MVRLTSLVLAVLALCGQSIAMAQTTGIPPLRVLARADGDDSRRCNVSHSSAVAQAKATLRYNRIPIVADDAVLAPALWVYVGALAGQRDSAAYTNDCAVVIRVEIKHVSDVRLWGESDFGVGHVDMCSDAALLVGPTSDIATRVADGIQRLVNNCLAEAEITYARARGQGANR